MLTQRVFTEPITYKCLLFKCLCLQAKYKKLQEENQELKHTITQKKESLKVKLEDSKQASDKDIANKNDQQIKVSGIVNIYTYVCT